MAQAVQFAILGLGARRGVHAARAGHRPHLPRLRHRQLRGRRHRDVRRVLLFPDARRATRLAGRSRDPGRGAVRGAARRRHPERHPPLHARGGTAGPPGRDARSAGGAPGPRRRQDLGHRLPPGRPVPAHAQLHVARVVRLPRRAGPRGRPGRPADPARNRDRADVRALGLHAVHEDRARDLRERGERARGVRARDGRRTSSRRSRGRSAEPPRAWPASCSRPTRG